MSTDVFFVFLKIRLNQQKEKWDQKKELLMLKKNFLN